MPPLSANSPIHVVPSSVTSGVSPEAMALAILSCAASHGIAVTSTSASGLSSANVCGEVAEDLALGAHGPDLDGALGGALLDGLTLSFGTPAGLVAAARAQTDGQRERGGGEQGDASADADSRLLVRDVFMRGFLLRVGWCPIWLSA